MDLRGFQPLRILKNVSFKVNSDLKALDQVLSHFEQIYQPWIPRKDWLQCQLALAEGFTNAVRHAHGHLPPETPIEVQLTLTTQNMEMRIWDHGIPFDLEQFLDNLPGKNRELTGHGQGLPILNKIAAHLSYSRTDDERNCLLIVKQFSPVESERIDE